MFDWILFFFFWQRQSQVTVGKFEQMYNHLMRIFRPEALPIVDVPWNHLLMVDLIVMGMGMECIISRCSQ
jgi:hypothetical protein